ncbi:hypothetical protein [Sinanaerobacter chloroacetimidivorans]|uniref:hypothetical protein n=1 Tax=Sinanaerobacter chloroacetimidivorans TaxID=2818044 RepID=UPI001D04F327|nr:hypothetical protein [Sinanaerobacter chloroacetimidivorans]
MIIVPGAMIDHTIENNIMEIGKKPHGTEADITKKIETIDIECLISTTIKTNEKIMKITKGTMTTEEMIPLTGAMTDL